MKTTEHENRAAGAASSTSETSNPPPKPPLLIARNLLSFERPKPKDHSELLEGRFLCRRGGALICGATGIGKSSLGLQLAILFALGRGCFGLNPVRPLKSLIIQAENDDGDISEFRDGVFAGYGLNGSEIKAASDNVVIHYEDVHRGNTMTSQVASPLCEHHKPDLLWLDHALAYLGGDAREQDQVGKFLRNQINPLLRTFDCGAFILHHANKPMTGRSQVQWSGGDFAYLGSGSIEWANWARAILTVRESSEGIFEFRAPKRGQRLGWVDRDGKRTDHIHIAHMDGKICWRGASDDEGRKGKSKLPKRIVRDLDVLETLESHEEGLSSTEWEKAVLNDYGIRSTAFGDAKNRLRDSGRVELNKKTRLWFSMPA